MIKLPDTEDLHDKGRLGDPTGPGPRLRAAREACGYDIQDIAKQLRLHPHVIADLERDKFADHLALVFVRGYLRAYAGLIGLDPEEVVQEFNAMGYKEDRDLPDLKGQSQSSFRMRGTGDMYKSRNRSGVKWAAVTAITVALGALFVAFNYEPQEQIYPAPVISDVSQHVDASIAPGTDPTLPPAAPVNPNAPTADANAAPAPTTGGATPVQQSAPARTPARATAAKPAAPGYYQAQPAPATAPGAAAQPMAKPAPEPQPQHEDDYDEEEPELPRPGSDD